MKPGYKYSHVGIPTQDRNPPTLVEGANVWITDFADDPFGVEWLRFEENSPMPELMKKVAHVAFEVEDLNAALVGEKVIVEPFPVGDHLTCAFIDHDGCPVELMQYR